MRRGRSNARKSFLDNSAAQHWAAVLERWPELHLNLLPRTITRLAGLFDDPRTATARERFMFGTDWFMWPVITASVIS